MNNQLVVSERRRRRRRTSILFIVVALTVFLFSFGVVLVESSPHPTPGWSRRRIATVIWKSSLSRAEQTPFGSAISEVVLARRNTGTKRTQQHLSPTTTTTALPLSIPQRLVSGGCSRGIAQAFLYPVDALRTLAQTRDGRTLADVGANSLIRGCLTTSSFAVLIGSIQFAIFGATRKSFGPMVSSAMGAAGSCLVSVPQEVIKQRLVTGVYSSFRSAVTTIYKTEGVVGFYSAWRPTVARNVPFVVATFTSMDFLKQLRLGQKKRISKTDGGGDDNIVSLTVAENLAIGITSSLIGGALTHPADVIKTRLMTQAASTAVPYKSTVDCIQTIWKTEGWKSFYSGFAQRSVYIGPLWAMQFALNERFHAAFQSQNTPRTSR